MPVRFYLASYLRPFAGGHAEVWIPSAPATVAAALEELGKIHPGIRDRVLTERGELRLHVNVFVGPESVRFAAGLQTAVPADCEISILPAVSGG
jgi:molybdopterin converting factor small subunit